MESKRAKNNKSATKHNIPVSDPVEEPSDQQEEEVIREPPFYSEMKAIAGGNANFIGSLITVEIAFVRIPALEQINLIHNLVSLTLICTDTPSLVGVETAAHSLEVLDCTGC